MICKLKFQPIASRSQFSQIRVISETNVDLIISSYIFYMQIIFQLCLENSSMYNLKHLYFEKINLICKLIF